MKPVFSGSACTLLLAGILSSCQTIPEAPLSLESHLGELSKRIPAPEPVVDYARALAAARQEDEVPFDLADGVTLQEAGAIALWYNSDLRMERLNLERQSVLRESVGRWDDPEFSLSGGRKRVESEDPSGAPSDTPNPPKGVDRSWISAASLSITIPLSGRPWAEKRAQFAALDTARMQVAEAEWAVLRDLQESWIHWSAAIERARLLEEHLTLVDQFYTIAQALAEGGELEPGGARMLLIERTQKEATHQQVLMEVDERKADLLHRMGLLPTAELDLLPSVASLDAPMPTPENHAWALNHPSIQRLRAAYAEAEARLRLELRKQYPDITLTPGWEDEDDESSINLGLGFPVPVWNANRQGIADAAADRDLARAKAESALEQLLAEQTQALARANGARARRERLAAIAAPAVDEQMAEAQALLRVGEADPSLLFQALGQAISIKLEILEAGEAEQVATSHVASLLAPRFIPIENLESQQ